MYDHGSTADVSLLKRKPQLDQQGPAVRARWEAINGTAKAQVMRLRGEYKAIHGAGTRWLAAAKKDTAADIERMEVKFRALQHEHGKVAAHKYSSSNQLWFCRFVWLRMGSGSRGEELLRMNSITSRKRLQSRGTYYVPCDLWIKVTIVYVPLTYH